MLIATLVIPTNHHFDPARQPLPVPDYQAERGNPLHDDFLAEYVSDDTEMIGG